MLTVLIAATAAVSLDDMMAVKSSSVSLDDMMGEYNTIFPHGNRNAASHRWATWILSRSKSLSTSDFETLFSGFCPVSGSPVQPSPYKRYLYELPNVDGVSVSHGFLHHCCAPCICDTLDKIAVDTKTVNVGGTRKQFNFAVIGDPCVNAAALTTSYVDAFQHTPTTLAEQATDVNCGADGKLVQATYSDHGKVIIGLLAEAPSEVAQQPAPAQPQPGRVTTVGGVTFQDAREFAGFCSERAEQGYASGMGLIFRKVAEINPLAVHLAATSAKAAAGGGGGGGGGVKEAVVAPKKKSCDGLLSASDARQLEQMLSEPLALFGWSGCPCTNIARSRFESAGACYVQLVWPTDEAPLYKYLQCKHGESHHSFVFANGKFVGDGFALEAARMPQPAFDSMLRKANARLMCQKAGDMNLDGKALQPCTQSNDGSTTGWTRTGSCEWDPSDSGYHEVCVTMSDKFLQSSAQHDANDLSSVVNAGGHWCICAWAWASAVTRDPASDHPEGITLECDRTNLKLREVYESHIASGSDLHSPSGAAYKAKTALDAVDRVCGRGGSGGSAGGGGSSGTSLAAAGASTLAAQPASSMSSTATTAAGQSTPLVGAAAVAAVAGGGVAMGTGAFFLGVFGVLVGGVAYVLCSSRRRSAAERVRLTKGMSAHHLDDELGQYDSAAGDSGGEESIAVGETPSTYQTLVVKKL